MHIGSNPELFEQNHALFFFNFTVITQSNYPLVEHFTASLLLFSLWAVNYFPFFLMFRQLYIHHYYPALYFSSLLTGVVIDWSIKSFSGLLPQQISPMFRLTFFLSFFLMLCYSFIEFSPLVYGMTGDMAKFSNSSHHHLYWLDWWDLQVRVD